MLSFCPFSSPPPPPNAEHKYPYDWRSKKPTIFRATEQWFASVDGFKAAALEAIRSVEWVPAQVGGEGGGGGVGMGSW